MSEQFKSIETTELVKIANAIRTKTGTTDKISLEDMPAKIAAIESGATLPELENEGAAADLLSGKELIDSEGNIVTGTIPIRTNNNLSVNGANVTVPKGYYSTDVVAKVSSATQATPSVSVNSSGLITATATQTAGYVAAGTKSGTKQLATQAAKTITPSKSSQTAVASGKYTTGEVTVAAIPSKYVDVSGATASASDVMSGKTFGAGTAVKTGTFTLDSELTTQESLISQIATALEGKAAGGGGTSVETCTFTFTGGSSNYYPKYISYMIINESGVITTIEETCSSNSVTVNCLCDSIVVVQTNGGSLFNATARCELLYTQSSLAVFHIVAGNGQNASARAGMGGGSN